MALIDVLGAEIERDAGIPMRWYDVLVHLEETPDGLRMKDLAERILYSKSGFTNVVDRMEKEGLVQRVRPENDRRSILVVLTDTGHEDGGSAPLPQRQASNEHFSRHLADSDIKALTRAFEKLHPRPPAAARAHPRLRISARSGNCGGLAQAVEPAGHGLTRHQARPTCCQEAGVVVLEVLLDNLSVPPASDGRETEVEWLACRFDECRRGGRAAR